MHTLRPQVYVKSVLRDYMATRGWITMWYSTTTATRITFDIAFRQIVVDPAYEAVRLGTWGEIYRPVYRRVHLPTWHANR